MKYKEALLIIHVIYKFVTPRDWTAARISFMSVMLMRIQITSSVLLGERVTDSATGPRSPLQHPVSTCNCKNWLSSVSKNPTAIKKTCGIGSHVREINDQTV